MRKCGEKLFGRIGIWFGIVALFILTPQGASAATHEVKIVVNKGSFAVYQFEYRVGASATWIPFVTTENNYEVVDTRISYFGGWAPDDACGTFAMITWNVGDSCAFTTDMSAIRIYSDPPDTANNSSIYIDGILDSTRTNVGSGCITLIYEKAIGLSGTISINDNYGFTKNPRPTFTITPVATIEDSIRYALDTLSPTAWKARPSTDSLTTPFTQPGVNKIYYKLKNATNTSAWMYDETIWDTGLPTSTISTGSIYGPSGYSNPLWVNASSISGTASDVGAAGLDSIFLTIQRSSDNLYFQGGTSWLSSPLWLKATGGANWTYNFSQVVDNVSYTISAKARDKALNEQAPVVTKTFLYSSSAGAIGTLTVPQYSKTPAFVATLASSNSVSMKVGLISDTGSLSWETFGTSKTVTAQAQGSIVVAAKFKNLVGESNWIYGTTIYDATLPTATITSPAIASGTTAQWPGSITGTATDPGSGVVSGVDSIKVQIISPTNKYWDGTGWNGTPNSWLLATGSPNFTYAIASTNFSADGDYHLRVRTTDKAGNIQNPITDNVFKVLNPPTVKVVKKTDTIVAPNPWTLALITTGTINSYSWFRVGNANPIANASGATLTLSSTSIADNNAQFYCEVGNGIVTVKSDICTLRVIEKVKANFSGAPLVGLAPVTSTFNDSSTGSIVRWRIKYLSVKTPLIVDTTSYSTRPTNISHVFNDTVDYDVIMKVYGQTYSGLTVNVDSQTVRVSVLSKNANPVKISAKFISGTSIDIRLSGKICNKSVLVNRYSDELTLYFGRHGLPINLSTDLKLRNFATTAAELGTQNGDTLILDSTKQHLVTVPLPATVADQYYSFWISPTWKLNGALVESSEYSNANAAAVRMAPVNTFAVTGTYKGNKTGSLSSISIDTANVKVCAITIANAQTLDTATDKVGIRFVAKGANLFNDEIIVRSAFLAGIQSGSFVHRVTNDIFFGDTQTVKVGVYQISKNGLPGNNGIIEDTVWSSFIVGFPRIKNTSSLRIESTQSSAALAKWDAIQGVDSIRVLVSANDFSLGQVTVPSSTYSVTKPATLSDGMVWVGSLKDSTTYYFALQVMQNMLWSDITSSTKTMAITKKVNINEIIENKAEIISVTFDSTQVAFNVSWLRPVNTNVASVGITYGIDSNLVYSLKTPYDGGFGQVVTATPAPLNGTEVISVASSVVFDTTYYVAIWLKSQNGPWSKPIMITSKASVKSPKFTRQVVTLFPSNEDTVRGFNNTVLFVKTSTKIQNYVDTLKISDITSPSPNLIRVSNGVSMGLQFTYPVFIGFTYTLPGTESPTDIGLYRDSAGVKLAVYGFTVDYDRKIVWINSSILDKTKDKFPFVVMVDKVRPILTFNSFADTGTVLMSVPTTSDEADTFSIKDQIGNVRYELQYAKGGASYDTINRIVGYVRSDLVNQTITTISSSFITIDNGLRARLIISDGPHTDTIQMSRQIQSDQLNPIVTEELVWTPIPITRKNLKEKIEDVLGDPLSTVNKKLFCEGDVFTYNIKKFRLFTWKPTANSGASDANWKEYSVANSDDFNMIPGRVFWIKTKEGGSGEQRVSNSISQKSSFEIKLLPKTWTDVAVPFKYNIKMGDILDSTGVSYKEDLQIYSWMREANKYRADLLFGASFSNKSGNDIVVPSQDRDYYTIYNNSSNEITLRIPPIPEAMSVHNKPIAKQASNGSWMVKITGTTKSNTPLSTSYVSFIPHATKKTEYFGAPPSLYQARFGIVDAATKTVKGSVVYRTVVDGGVVATVGFVNNSENADLFTYSLEGIDIPKNWQMRTLDPQTGIFVPATSGLQKNVDANSTGYETIAMGDEAFFKRSSLVRQNVKFSIVSLYPNPFRGILTVRYTVPLTGISGVRFSIVDCRGRTLFTRTQRSLVYGDVNTFRYVGNRTVGAGMYFLRVETLNADNKVVAHTAMRVSSAQ